MDLIEVKISDITLTNVGFAVFLKPKDVNTSKVVPIFIGPLETHAITSVLEGIISPRPMTHDLVNSILNVLNTSVVNITIDQIIDNTFYAKITLRKDEDIFVMDARPSDSIAIALRSNAPVFITESILNEAGVEINPSEISGEAVLETSETETAPKPVTRTALEILEDSLKAAISSEDYESAAKIRDQIKKMVENS